MVKHILLLYDLDLWPTSLTYDPSLAKVKVDPHAKNQGQGSKWFTQESLDKQTNIQTDKYTNKRTLPNLLSPLLRGP